MAGHSGRKLTIDLESTTLVSVRSKGFSESREYPDVTTDDDAGQATYLADVGKAGGEITIAGVTSDEVLIGVIFEFPVTSDAIVINLPTGVGATTPGKIAGDYLITALSMTGQHDGAVEFEATMVRTGAATYTATVA